MRTLKSPSNAQLSGVAGAGWRPVCPPIRTPGGKQRPRAASGPAEIARAAEAPDAPAAPGLLSFDRDSVVRTPGLVSTRGMWCAGCWWLFTGADPTTPPPPPPPPAPSPQDCPGVALAPPDARPIVLLPGAAPWGPRRHLCKRTLQGRTALSSRAQCNPPPPLG
jgi:hypothetical protein